MRMPGGPGNNRHVVVDTTGVNKRSTLWRLFKIVMKHYKFSFLAVAVCIVVTACTTLASPLGLASRMMVEYRILFFFIVYLITIFLPLKIYTPC